MMQKKEFIDPFNAQSEIQWLTFFFQSKPYNSFLFTSFDCVIFFQCSLWRGECESIQLNFIAQARAEFACQIGSLFDVGLSKEMNTQQFWRCKMYLCSHCQLVWTSGVTFFWFQLFAKRIWRIQDSFQLDHSFWTVNYLHQSWD